MAAAWTRWRTTLEWDEGRPRVECLEVFLAILLERLAWLGAALHEAADVDVLAALSGRLQQLEAPPSVDAALMDDQLAAVDAASLPTADDAQVIAWTTLVTELLEGDATCIQWTALAILAERVLRATLASRADLDPDGVLLTAADTVETQVRQVLLAVLQRVVSPADYRVM